MQLFNRYLVLGLLAVCIACGNQAEINNNSTKTANGQEEKSDPFEDYRKEQEERARHIQTLDEAIRESLRDDSIQIVPIAGGGAYVLTQYGVWFLKDSSAYRVTSNPVSSLNSGGPTVKPKAKDLGTLWLTESGNLMRAKRKVRDYESQIEELKREIEELKSKVGEIE